MANRLLVFERKTSCANPDHRGCLELARETINRLGAHLDEGVRERVVTHARSAAGRLLQPAPRDEQRKWLAVTFPELAAVADVSRKATA